MKNNFLILIFSTLLISACGNSDDMVTSPTTGETNTGGTNTTPDNTTNDDWLVPVSEVRDGGPGKDGIPSIDSPEFWKVNEVSNTLTDDLLVIGIKVGDVVRAYPHYILDWHEIVNDNLKDVSVAVTYCPLTGSALGWDRRMNGTKTSFGVSGKLYNSNLIPYDRSTDSNWSQLGLQCINGELIGDRPRIVSLVETTWGVWKSMYPASEILNTSTGFERPYGFYPYGDYKTNNGYFIFPINPLDNRLPSKERVLAIISNNESMVFRFSSFGQGTVIKVVFKGEEILVVGDQETMVAFKLNNQTSLLNFEYAYNGSETFFKDHEGTEWNIFGEAISGPGAGGVLTLKTSFIAYWFSVGAFYPDAKIFL